MESYDIVIVGAGPAGLKCAEVLAKNNKKVLVLEKNKIIGDKVCGGLILKHRELKIPNKIIQRKFRSAIFITPHQKTKLKFKKNFVVTVDRKDLGKWMAENARKAGAEIRTQNPVTKIDSNTITVNGKKIQYKYLVGADGSSSIVRKYLGLKTNVGEAFQYIVKKRLKNLETIFNPDKFGAFYLWVVPYKKSAAIGTGLDLRKQNILDLKTSDLKKNLDEFCKTRFDIKKAKFQAATISYGYQGHEFKNIFLAGDAAGFAPELTGAGIYFAIKSGEDIAKKIINPKYKQKNIAHILKIKKTEDKIAKSLEVNKTLTEAEWELFNFLMKIKWVEKEVFTHID
jgi:geranylgeranyl reductase